MSSNNSPENPRKFAIAIGIAILGSLADKLAGGSVAGAVLTAGALILYGVWPR